MGSVKKAVIPAAGFGTRFLPVTKAQPKEMIAVVDRPAIQYVVEEAVAAGIEDILIVSASGKRSMEDHFDRMWELEAALEAKGKEAPLKGIRDLADMAHIHFVRQGEALGLGHAVGVGASHVGDDSFAVLLPDDLMVDQSHLLKAMIALHDEHDTSVVALKEYPLEEVENYGCARPEAIDGRDDVVSITEIVEKPAPENAPSNLAVMGRYVFTAEIFENLAKITPGAGGELQLTDAMAMLIGAGGLLGQVFETGRFDIGQPALFLETTVELAAKHPELGPEFTRFLKDFVAGL